MEDRTLLSTFMVGSIGDSGPGSLRQAILDANIAADVSVITFDATVFATPQTINLTSGQLELSNTSWAETILGPAAGVTVDAGGNSRVFQVDEGVAATLSGMTISGGNADNGGGLLNNGSATVAYCAFTNNSAGSNGGGLANLGTATLTDCTISGNSSSNNGGGLYSGFFHKLNLTNCTVSGNSSVSGGGILTVYSTTTVSNCTISGNFASAAGGGWLDNNGQNAGSTTLIGSTISGNSSSGNSAGLYVIWGATTLTDCTISGNSSRGGGGGIFDIGASVTLGNTIVAGNTAVTGPDAAGDFISLGNNLIGETDGSTGWVGSDLTGTIALPLDPRLAPLGDYGGTIQTMALLSDSPAINAGNVALIPTGIYTDARGALRTYQGTVDIGAVEFRMNSLVSIVTSPGSSNVAKGLKNQFNALGTFSDGATRDLTNIVNWASTKPSVETIDRNGLATAVTVGSSVITASLAGVTSPAVSMNVSPAAVVSVTLFPETSTRVLPIGATYQFTAQALYTDGSTLDVTNSASWNSSDSSVVAIDGNGLARALVQASSVITATFADVTSPRISLTVTPPLVSIAITPRDSKVSLAVLTYSQFIAQAFYSDGSTEDITSSVTWNSSDSTIVSIDVNGLASGESEGSCVVTASLAGITSAGVTLQALNLFTVSSTADSGPGSFRQAINDSNSRPGKTNTIVFAIPGPGVQTIQPLSSLPSISTHVLIDGFSQPGYAGTPLIELNGGRVRGGQGLRITGSGVTVRGLDINSFGQGYGIFVNGASAFGNWIYGNVIGTDPTGTMIKPNSIGVYIRSAANNLVGSNGDGVDDAAESNLISGNSRWGVLIFGTRNSVVGNVITQNNGPGVVVGSSASNKTYVGNRISANRIFGNTGPAIDLSQDGVTSNSSDLRTGPNNRQNFPIIVTTADGGLQGSLFGSTPNTTFQIEVFASAGFSPQGSGEGQEYLGTFQVTTDAGGTAIFSVPFTPPSGLPIISATATDPLGNTSEISAVRQGVLRAPGGVHFGPGHPVSLSTSGSVISIQDRDAGPLDPAWQISLSVPIGTLTFLTLDGLVGSGQGTGSVVYQGSRSAINSALAGLIYTPPTGDHIACIMTVNATSDGAKPLQSQVLLSDGLFAVTTTADSGPGSLRQAILDSNAATGGRNTINFAIPGAGVQTIAPESPLPAITNPLLIDGTSQPGFSGTSLIVLSGQSLDSSNPLQIAGAATLRGVTIHGFTFSQSVIPDVVALQSVPFPAAGSASNGAVDHYLLVTNGGEQLTVIASAQGVTMRLILRDADGNVLTQSDGQSAAGGNNLINIYVPAGTYFLDVEGLGGSGTYSLTASGLQATDPSVSLPMDFNMTEPSSVITGDFNGDGNLDLAVGISNWGTIATYLGNGDGTFQPRVFSGLTCSVIAAGDFDGDGKLDLACVSSGPGGGLNYLNQLSILTGNGDGTFTLATQSTVGTYSNAIAVGDFNGDGKIDLAVSSRSEKAVSVLLGNGDCTFKERVKYSAGARVSEVTTGDFNGDGIIDLVAVNQNEAGTISVLIGNGDGTFAAQRVYEVGVSPSSVVAADFNGDGHLDLAVTNQVNPAPNGTVSVLMGNGDGTFQSLVAYAAGNSPSRILKGDFNNDGKIDLEVVNGATNSGTVSFLSGKGDGSFLPPVTINTTGQPGGLIAAGDFNHDGRLDFAYASGGDSNGVPSSVEVRLGYGDGTFQQLSPPSGTSLKSEPNQAAAGDFNSDGRMDLAVTSSWVGTLSILLGNGDGTFAVATTYPVGKNPGAIVAGDFNGDGRTDLAVVNGGDNTVSVLLGNGDGTFASQVTYAVVSPTGIVAADFNGDGRIDLAVVNGGDNNTVSVLLGKGDGTFAPPVAYTVTSPGGIVAGDFNGDGRIDLAVVNVGVNTVSILQGNGNGTFATPVTYSAGTVEIGEIAAGDFNGDGHLDLVVGDFGSDGFSPISLTGFVSVLLGKGDGTFPSHVEYKVGVGLVKISVGDFNGDGHLDLAVANFFGVPVSDGGTVLASTSSVSVLLGKGDGTFAPQVPYDVGNFLSSIIAAPFNGRLNLASLTASDNAVSVKLIDRDGSYADPGQFAIIPMATPLTADVNGDGTDDVLVVDATGNILYRQGITGQPGSFVSPLIVNPDTPSRDITWLPNTDAGPVLASVDSLDNAITLYAYRNGVFIKLLSLTTGKLPAQVIAADLNHDGRTDLVVRNAGDGTLSIFYGGSFIGPRAPGVRVLPAFATPMSLHVGLGVSDVKALDLTGSGRLDLVVTNKLSGQLGILRNIGDGSFTSLSPYRAGTGISVVKPGTTPNIASLDTTIGFAAGAFSPDAPTAFVTINPATLSLGVIAGLGNGRFSNPSSIRTQSPAQVVRMADLTGNGIDDLAVLSVDGVSVYLGDGKGGFSKPVTYFAGPSATGLTLTDVTNDGHPDLLVGNAYGDVLLLVGVGDGTFRSYQKANQGVALATADLTGTGKTDFIFANEGLDRVVVQYGGNKTDVVGDRSSGLLAPGAIKLADLNGDGIPDLIVANSGSNNILVYPGLGNGQFGPATNGGHGYYAGTNPTGIEVANLNGQPDVIVANAGSNDVSILLGQGTGDSWTLTPGPRIKTAGGPVAVAVGKLTNSGQLDLAVANQQANNVQVFPGIGSGYFSQTPTTYAVGNAPSGLFLGNFNGSGQGIAAINSGSNTISLIGQNGVTQTLNSGGLTPTSGFAGQFSGNGYTDLVVGNSSDGHFAYFSGGPNGLSLSLSTSSAEITNPTSLSFAGVSNDVVSFYAAGAGHEAASLLAFNLHSSEDTSTVAPVTGLDTNAVLSVTSTLVAATTGAFQQVSQLLGLNGSAFDLIATLLTVTTINGEFETATSGVVEVNLLANFLPTTGSAFALSPLGRVKEESSHGSDVVNNSDLANALIDQVLQLPIWERLAVGMERAWTELRENILKIEGVSPELANRAADLLQNDAPASSGPSNTTGQHENTRSSQNSQQAGVASPLNEFRDEATQIDGTDTNTAPAAALESESILRDRLEAEPADELSTLSNSPSYERLAGPLGLSVGLLAVSNLSRWIRTIRYKKLRLIANLSRQKVMSKDS